MLDVGQHVMHSCFFFTKLFAGFFASNDLNSLIQQSQYTQQYSNRAVKICHEQRDYTFFDTSL